MRASDPADENHARLVEGLSSAIAEKGYRATTIADIVRHARVSKRTFYEHFDDKEACFLAAYRAESERLLQAVAAAVAPDATWEAQVTAATRAYFRLLEENPAAARTFLVEIHAAGPRALTLRREIHQRFAELLRQLVRAAKRQHRDVRPLSPAMATAIVGGVNELVLVALEERRTGGMKNLANTAADLVRAVLA